MQGMGTMVTACAVSEALYLMLIEYLRENFPFGSSISDPDDASESNFGRDALSAYAADVTSRFIYVPMSIVSFRQMTQYQFSSANPAVIAGGTTARHGAWSVMRGLYAEGGVRSVFCGLGMTLMIGSQWSALWWATYLSLKDVAYDVASPFLLPNDASSRWNALTSRDDNIAVNTAVSVVTSASTSLLFNPFFVLRVNMQLTPRATFLGTAKELYRRGGARVFLSGAYLNMLSSTLDGVLASSSYEYAKLFADRTRQ